MVIHKVKSRENKGYQLYQMVRSLLHKPRKNNYLSSYEEVMNMKTYTWKYNYNFIPVTLAKTYHFNPKKW